MGTNGQKTPKPIITNSFLEDIYYLTKPVIPSRLALTIRRRWALRKRKEFENVWPIYEGAAVPPEGWSGWPDNKKFALVLTHDVETSKGQENCRNLAALDEEFGFRASFNFVARQYAVDYGLLQDLRRRGFEIGIHGLLHEGNLFRSYSKFQQHARVINKVIKEWDATGFRCPSMYHNLDWIGELDIEYDSSTFDTDPFEPQPDGMDTIFPLYIGNGGTKKGYVELPYTLPQDFAIFILMREKGPATWKKKLDWIAGKGGMALLISHPDYMNFGNGNSASDQYPAEYYGEFLRYVRDHYKGQYWHVLPREMSRFWIQNYKSAKPRKPFLEVPGNGREKKALPGKEKRIWVDLDNSPHVPFFKPIMRELEKRNLEIVLTTRDCSQTCGLADLFQMKYKRIGRHYGKNRILKVAGTVFRALQLSQEIRKEKPALAVSHGSRAQMLAAWLLGIPSVVIMDYEHVTGLGFLHPTWIMMPEVLSTNGIKEDKERIIPYPGIKEDVYVPTFQPDPAIRETLGIRPDDLMVTIRPPATEAHYHNPASEALFSAAVNLLGNVESCRMVILPRYTEQEEWIRRQWAEWCRDGKIVIPEKVVDGLNLLWFSDFVISGGGTMNREAAALGIPVYSLFRGKIGAVDRYLVKTGRLTLLESVKDVHTKLSIVKRSISSNITNTNGNRTLKSVTEGIVKVLENGSKELDNEHSI